jgi:hypothetical protein
MQVVESSFLSFHFFNLACRNRWIRQWMVSAYPILSNHRDNSARTGGVTSVSPPGSGRRL